MEGALGAKSFRPRAWTAVRVAFARPAWRFQMFSMPSCLIKSRAFLSWMTNDTAGVNGVSGIFSSVNFFVALS